MEMCNFKTVMTLRYMYVCLYRFGRPGEYWELLLHERCSPGLVKLVSPLVVLHVESDRSVYMYFVSASVCIRVL